MRNIDHVSGEVLDVVVKLLRERGPGLFESVYELRFGEATLKEGVQRVVNDHCFFAFLLLRVNKN